MHARWILRIFQVQFFLLGSLALFGSNKAGIDHAIDHIHLTTSRTGRIVERIVGARCLGQAGEHRGFGNRDVLQRLAEIGLRRGGEPISAVAQVDLIQVNLEDLVFAQRTFQLESEQHLIDLAGKGSL